MQKILYFIVVLIFVTSCESGIDVPSAKPGEADFTLFVSLGDSYTAGYTNGALSAEGQQTSFASLLAQQISWVSAQNYSIPLLPPGQSVGSSLKGEMVLVNSQSGPAPITTDGNPELLTNPETWINQDGPYQNLGIPGARVFHLTAPAYGNPANGAGNFNPYYARFASNPGLSTALSDALVQEPTFFSLWIGGNDVLAYALAGGEGGTEGTGGSDITPLAVFQQSYEYLLNQLTLENAKGVTATIPSIDRLPYFNTVLPNALTLNADQAIALQSAYADYNTDAAQYGLEPMTFIEGNNFFVIEDENHPLGRRQIKAAEKLLLSLPRENITAAGWGSQVPVPAQYVLDERELQSIGEATDEFNGAIIMMAEKYDLALVDLPGLLNTTAAGYMLDGVTYHNGYITGGLFSLDGIHTTGRGSAIVANAFIEAINRKYNSTIPYVDVNSLWGIEFP